MNMRRVFELIAFSLIIASFAFALDFTDEFDGDSYIQVRTTSITNSTNYIGYPDVDYSYPWYGEWGDVAYYGGYFYMVWVDRRYDGNNQVFLTKLDSYGNVVFSTNIEVSIVGTTNSYFEISTRPTISIFDANNIYIAYSLFRYGSYRVIVTKWQDTGSSLDLIWSRRADNGFGDQVSYTPVLFKLFSTVGANGELYLGQVWNRIGSGETSWISKINPDGTQYWISGINPGTQYMTTFNSGTFIIAGEVIYDRGHIYVTGQHWIWSPSRDFGVGINKISTNNTYASLWGDGTNISDRGIVYDHTRGNAPKVDLTLGSGGDIFAVFSDKRNGNMDVFITRINTNTGAFVWSSPSVRVVAGGAGNQECPSIVADSTGNVFYVSYIDNSSGVRVLKIAKVDNAGNVLGTMTANEFVYSGTLGVVHPKIFVDSSGAIYVFLAESAGSGTGKIRVKAVKYDSFAGNLQWVKEFPEIPYKKYAHVTSKRILPDLVGTPKSVKVNAVYNTDGGQVVFKVSPDGGLNWYDAPTNTSIVFTNIGNDLRVKIELLGNGSNNVSIDRYTLTVETYYTGDIFGSTNSNYTYSIGSNYINSYTPSAQVVTNYTISDGVNKSIFYFTLMNTGNTNGKFYLYASPSKSWPLVIYDWDNNNITTSILSGNYNIDLTNGEYKRFRIEVTPPSSVIDNEVMDIILYSSATNGNYPHDSIIFKTIAWKYLPDSAISNSSGLSGTNVWETTPILQLSSNTVNSLFYGYETKVTNFIYIYNRGVNSDVISIGTNFSSTGSIDNWNISLYNISDSQDVSSYPYYVSIPSGGVKVFRFVVYPKTNSVTGEVLSTEFTFRSTNIADTNDTLRVDKVKFVYENHKVQPDVIVSTNIYFLGGVENNNYVYTNSQLTQSIMVRTVNNVSLTYYIKIENDGLEDDVINIYSSGITNEDWNQVYYIGVDDITSVLTNTGTNVSIPSGGYVSIKAVFTPGSSVDSGVEPWVSFVAYSTKVTNVFDKGFSRPRNIKVRPDLIVGYDSSSINIGNDVYNSDGSNQWVTNVVERNEKVTNFVVVQNDSLTDPDIVNLTASPGGANWGVQYLDYNNNDISYITNSPTNFTLPYLSSVTLKVVSWAGSSVYDDEIKVFSVRLWSSYVASQEDVVLISNRVISVKPDLGVLGEGGWADLPVISSYSDQASTNNRIIAGRTNSYKVKLKNDTGSVQDYVFEVNITNVGGSISDWGYSFRAVVGSSTNDITTSVTNTGWTKTYSSNEVVYVLLDVYLTNAVESDIGTTNGAVSNYIDFKYDFSGVFRTNYVDRGMHRVNVVRGLPEAYHEVGGIGLGYIGDFSTDNFLTYGITLKYPRDILLRFKNSGYYVDKFRIYALVSNSVGEITNWIYRLYDSASNDITSYITNTNVGWTNDITNNYEKIVRMEVVNSNGFVNDEIYVYFYFDSVTKEVRRDTVWYKIVVTPGLPDVAISNLVTGEVKATNQFAPDSSEYRKLESGENSRYRILLRNIAPIAGFPPFKLTVNIFGDTSKFDIYHTNKQGVYIDNATLSTTGYSNNISNYNAINGWPEDWLNVLIVPKDSVVPGDKVILVYTFQLYDQDNVYDRVYITNQFVSPGSKVLSQPSYTNIINVFIGKYQGVSGYFIVSNTDVVWEDFKLSLSQSSATGWALKVYTNSTDITSYLTNFSTGVIPGNGIMLFSYSISNTQELVSGSSNVVTITSRPKKNTNISSTLVMNFVYVDAVADLFSYYEGSEVVGRGIFGGEVTNKIRLNTTNLYTVVLSNAISSGDKVRFVLIVESNNTPESVVNFFDSSGNDITSSVLSSNYVVSLAAGEYTNVYVRTVLTDTNIVYPGFLSYLRLGLKTVDVENSIYDTIVLRDWVSKPSVDVRAASSRDPIWSFSSYSDSGKNVRTFKNVPTSIYIGILNNDVVPDNFVVRGSDGIDNWTVKYYNMNDQDITEDVVNGSYLTPSVGGGGLYIIKAVITPSVTVSPSDVLTQFVQVYSVEDVTAIDRVTNTVGIESMVIVGKVVDKKTKQPIAGAKIEVTDPYGVKSVSSTISNGEYSVPVYPVIGGQYRMVVNASGYVGAVTNIYLEIGTNNVVFELVGLNMSADKTDVRIFPNPTLYGKGGSFVYAVPEPGEVYVGIFDLSGKLIKTLVKNEFKDRGVYYVLWDGSDENGAYIKQGVYIFVIKTPKETVVKKLFVK
jgi:hypothetical protein